LKLGTFVLLILLIPTNSNAITNRLGETPHQNAMLKDEINFLLNRGYIELNVAHRFHQGSTSKTGCDFSVLNKSNITRTVKIPLQKPNKLEQLIGVVEFESPDPEVTYWLSVRSWTAQSGLYLDYSAHIKFRGKTLGSIQGASGQGVIYKERNLQKVGQDYLIRLIPERQCILAELVVSDSSTPIRLPKQFKKRIQ
jgi:hypothetical protein